MDSRNPVEQEALSDYMSKLVKTHPSVIEGNKTLKPEDITLNRWLDEKCENGHEIRVEKSKDMVRLKNKNTGHIFLAPNPVQAVR